MMEFDAPFWALVSLVAFFALVLYLRVPKTVTSALDQRADAIHTELDQARKLRMEAEELLAAYQKKARDAEKEAAEIVRQAKGEAEAMASEAARRTEEYVATRTRLAEQKIAQAEAQALSEVRAMAADVAVSAAEKLLAARLKGEAGDALVAKSIGSVKSKLN
jgi:F-type H+-transporting ATPase subunit b